ncbi:hypothetical protein E3T61_00765 [Cryobacterium lactosi]|uniref:DUF3558 domain-containing protein n=1 Tax=Cryobacterium lactosi TaxID=1259202 RepID=A0A4R9C096_9MICO|nr:hypothetical protein [Cryobacterium lactosi]TFD95200.1 hypothetical protein E3T61_00765 [Cryobacterium lactosi]
MGVRGRSRSAGALVPAALLAVALLAGCAAESPVPVEPAAGPIGTPAPADAVTAPAPRLGLDCAALVPDDLAAETVTTGLVPLPYAAALLGVGPLSFAIEQLGGTACAATDPAAPGPGDGAGPVVSGYTVLVLPDAAEQYARYAELYTDVTSGTDAPYGDSAGGACFGRGAESSCTSNILVGSTWIEVQLTGIDVDAAMSNDDVAERVAPLIESIVTTVAEAPAPGPLWTPAANAVALPDDCTVYATADEARSIFQRTEELWVGPAGGGGWSLPAGAWSMSGAERCSWLLENSDNGVLSVDSLPGGAWAYDAMWSLTARPDQGARNAESIPGVERASFACGSATETCSLDTVIGGNWVQFSTPSAQGDPDVLRDRLTQTAVGAAARLSG